MYPCGALLAANYSVPILWLSLFDTDGLVAWPGIQGGSTFTTIIQPSSECIERSRIRLGDWTHRWPGVFGEMPGPWLSYLSAVKRAYFAVWAEEISWMDGDESWAAELRGYLSCLDDPGSAGFHKVLAQSSLYLDGSQVEPAGAVGLVTAGYAWAGQAPWEGVAPGS